MAGKGPPASIMLKAGLIRSGCFETSPHKSLRTTMVEMPSFNINVPVVFQQVILHISKESNSPFLKVFQARLDGALNNLV